MKKINYITIPATLTDEYNFIDNAAMKRGMALSTYCIYVLGVHPTTVARKLTQKNKNARNLSLHFKVLKAEK